jgi:carbamoyl-phosphate synthase large subunit
VKKINVLVTGIGGFSHGSSIVKALIGSSLPLDILGTDMSPRLINASPLKKKELVPRAGDDGYIEKIIELIKSYSIDCIFTGTEHELLKVSQHRKELEACNVKVFLNNEDVISLCKNKLSCNQKLTDLGFNVPKTVVIETEEDNEAIDFFPVIIKPYIDSGASLNIFGADDREDLYTFTRYLLNKKLSIIAQEYLPYNNNEYTVGVTSLLDEPTVVSSIALRKFIEGPTRYINRDSIVISSGNSQGEFLEFKDIRNVCEKIAASIGSRGPLNIQLRVVEGKVIPFEINPRFSGTTSARALNGYNDPEFYIRKYLLNDPKATDSLTNTQKGCAVKVYEEHYTRYE